MKRLDSPCMFCGELPCVCNKPAGKAKTSKLKSQPQVKVEPSKPVFVAPQAQRDLTRESALEALYDIVCPADKRWIDKQLPKRQSNDWKSKHVG